MRSTHRLLDHFARNFSKEELSHLLAILSVPLYNLLDHVGNIGVHVRWSVGNCQIDLRSTLAIASKGSIVLQAIARAVLVDGKRRQVCMRVGRLKSGTELHAGGKALPWIVCLGPPTPTLSRNQKKIAGTSKPTHLQGILGTIIDIVKVVHHECHTFVETALVEPVQVGKMNLEPTETTFAERFRFRKHQKATGQVIADVTQVRRNGIRSSPKVKVMRKVERVSQELTFDQSIVAQCTCKTLTAREISIL